MQQSQSITNRAENAQPPSGDLAQGRDWKGATTLETQRALRTFRTRFPKHNPRHTNSTERHLLRALIDRMDDQGESFPSQSLLADDIECSRKTVNVALQSLVCKGFVLKVSTKGKRSLQYRLNIQLIILGGETEAKPATCNRGLQVPVTEGDTKRRNEEKTLDNAQEREAPPPPTDTQIYYFDGQAVEISQAENELASQMAKPPKRDFNVIDYFGQWDKSPFDKLTKELHRIHRRTDDVSKAKAKVIHAIGSSRRQDGMPAIPSHYYRKLKRQHIDLHRANHST